MSELPISCIRCRRRKIKCNKRKPCNQCSRKDVPCEFPSKFRNIAVQDSETAATVDHDSPESQDTSMTPPETAKLEEELRKLKIENKRINKVNSELRQSSKESSEALGTRDSSSDDLENKCKISGETTEKGEKYYGPLSSNNMMQDFNELSNNNLNRLSSMDSLRDHTWTTDSFKLSEDSTDASSMSTEEMRFMSLKKKLPVFTEPSELKSDSASVISGLVKYLFDLRSYDYFISENRILNFIESYPTIRDEDWEDDDYVLLLHMLLLLAVQRLNPTKFNEYFDPPVDNFEELWKRIGPFKKRLIKGFSELRHNLINESYVTVQAYIICVEWEFTMQRFEESWSMLFHCCSIAYALGLHVVTKGSEKKNRSPTSSASGGMTTERNTQLTIEDDSLVDEYFTDELPKLRVWLALRNLSSQLSSILGRPNPIMVQVNLITLPSSITYGLENVQSKNHLINSQLKHGLSECIRLSNANVIESFMRDIEISDVLDLNYRYGQEIDALSFYLSQQYTDLIDAVIKEIDQLTDMPTTITRKDVISDLIVLHVNRIKLLEPFLDQNPKNQDMLNFIIGSILLFLDHTCEIVLEFVKQELPRMLTNAEALSSVIRMDKIFRIRDPFLYTFIYQGVVVTFILINDKVNALMQLLDLSFLTQIEYKLQMLLSLHNSVSNVVGSNIHLWSTNNEFLMSKTLEHISVINQAQKDMEGRAQMDNRFDGFNYDPQVAEMLGSNLKDPFWIVNPENSPNFLGISNSQSNDNTQFTYSGRSLEPGSVLSFKMRQGSLSQQDMENLQLQLSQSMNSDMLLFNLESKNLRKYDN